MAKFYLAHARHDENGKLTGGQKGDQVQKKSSKNDAYGEVAITPFYEHKKGWLVFRPKNTEQANEIARLAKIAANNPNIGYDQNYHTNGLIRYGGVNAKVKTSTDCSGLVRQCIYEATNKDLGNFRTVDEPKVLTKSGLFLEQKTYTPTMKLYDGDIVCTKVKGHTAVIVDSKYSRKNPNTIKYVVGEKYETQTDLNIRKDHTTSSKKKTLKEVASATKKYCVKGLDTAKYKKGTKVTCKEIYEGKDSTWIRTVSGWVCGETKNKIYIK